MKKERKDLANTNQNVDISNRLHLPSSKVDLGSGKMGKVTLPTLTEKLHMPSFIKELEAMSNPVTQSGHGQVSSGSAGQVGPALALQSLINMGMSSPASGITPTTSCSTPHMSLLKEASVKMIGGQGFSSIPNIGADKLSSNKTHEISSANSGFKRVVPHQKPVEEEESKSETFPEEKVQYDKMVTRTQTRSHQPVEDVSPKRTESEKDTSNPNEESKDDIVLSYTRNGELSQRRDVVFKTIIRDMRKFFISDFNECTGFVKRKRYKRKAFYLTCVEEYMEHPHIKGAAHKGNRLIKDFSIYLGAVIYPKELEEIVQKKPHKRIAQEIYDALYKFSLGKMKNLLLKDAIFNLFMTYYQREIKDGNRLSENKTMAQHQKLYLEAFRIMTGINKKWKKYSNS